MTNTATSRSLSSDLSIGVARGLLSLSGHAVRSGSCGVPLPFLREMARLGWLERPTRTSVRLTSEGLDARSAVLCAAADAAQDWARRIPL